MFRVAIVGADDVKYDFFEQRCIFYLKNRAKEGIVINTTGEDNLIRFAAKWHIEYKVFNADWKHNGKDALKYRNHELLLGCNGAIVFAPNLKGNGLIRQKALEMKIPCRSVV